MVHIKDGVDGGDVALNVHAVVDGSLSHAQGEAIHLGDATGQLHGRWNQLVQGDYPIYHAQPFGLLGGDRSPGEQQFLGLARPQLPSVGVQLDAANAHMQDRIREFGVVGGLGPVESDYRNVVFNLVKDVIHGLNSLLSPSGGLGSTYHLSTATSESKSTPARMGLAPLTA